MPSLFVYPASFLYPASRPTSGNGQEIVDLVKVHPCSRVWQVVWRGTVVPRPRLLHFDWMRNVNMSRCNVIYLLNVVFHSKDLCWFLQYFLKYKTSLKVYLFLHFIGTYNKLVLFVPGFFSINILKMLSDSLFIDLKWILSYLQMVCIF
jgi:hypothetical protein